ncbi:hypothetical protein WR25_15080 [Diploscapter pachys]|uniref:Uncharacterized protein n=1 Tax=Diploscapter pachys TaxID=2018661 RepID=A0A2A2LL67_9BILA|nr:hypothetical protein WR25_15080 [Diploscapter pachys]
MSSSSANGDEAIASESKFKGEAYEIRDNRTVFVGSMEDSRSREGRVLLLAGPSSAGKTSLIDFLCNYFYGVRNAESQIRYRIANEKFDAASPERPIVTYIFNDTIMDYKPIVIDTPGAGKRIGINDASTLLAKWLLENKRMRLDAIGIVFSDVNRMTSAEEDELQKMISNFPVHVRSNMIVFVTDCDESAPQITRAILQRFNLQDAKIFRINSTCLYEKLQGDSLKEQLRQNYWKSSVEMFDEATNQIKANAPATISGEQFNPAAIVGAHQSSRRSSTSSASDTTVIHVPQSPRTHAVPPPSILTPVPPPVPLIPPPPVPVPEPVAAPISIPLPPASIPAESQPPKKVPRVGDGAEVASVRSSNYDYPNLPISSNLSSTVSESTRRKSKVTETHIYESKEVGSERQRLLPSEPIRMTDFSRVVESREPEPRRSIFYSPYSSSSSQLYVRPAQPPPVPPHTHTNISSTYSKSTSNVQETGAVVADTVRTYAQETTPPPVQHTDIANTYSTTSVTYVNNEQPRSEMIKTSHSPRQLKKETNAGLKDAIRLSREELRISESTGQDDMTSVRYRQPQSQYIPPSQPLTPTPIGRGVTPRGTTFSAGGTIIGTGVEPPKQIIRYAYDNDRHTYRPHAASTTSRGESRISRKIERTVERRWSSSEAPRTETVIDDPAYELGGRDISRGYGTVEIRRSKQSLASHKSSLHGSMPELVHSEDMTHVQERMPYKERIIDFPISQSKSTFDRDVQIRKSMRQSGGHEHQIGGGAGPKEVAIDVHITPRPSQIQQQTATTVTDQQRYENAPGQQSIPRYEDVAYAYAQPQRADYATTKGTVPQSGYATGQQIYRDSEYGSTWGDKAKGQGQSKMISTTTTDMRKSGQYATRNERNLGQPQYQPYQPSQSQRPITLPDPNDAEKGLVRDGKTGMSRDEQYHSSYRHQSRGRKSKSQTKSSSKSSSKEPTRIAFLNWTPSDYRDPYNCCLNFLYFVFAPLIVLAIIITIIVLVIFEH